MTDADVDGSHIRTLLLTFFFRHMRQLVDRGHVFIAQPPLYKVQHKNREEYVHNEKDMMRLLVDLGLDGTALEGVSRKLAGPELRRMIEAVLRVEDLMPAVQRKGLSMEKYLREWDVQAGRLPLYRARWQGRDHFFYSQESFDAFVAAEEKTAGRDIECYSDEYEGPPAGGQPSITLNEFHGAPEIEAAVKDLQALGFAMGEYFRAEAADGKPKYRLVADGEEHPVRTLRDVLGAIRAVGRKGLKDVKRFKGLGEMNADELWETTMDVSKRTLLKVTIEDVVEAERMFTVLMGEEVEPRREFIEKHALEVKFLDI